MTRNAFDLLKERGFFYQSTHEQELHDHLAQPRRFYIGFDPTADSLHVGSLVPIMAMVNMQRAGHLPIALVGGGTARVGDPSGKTEMRKMLSEERIEANEKGLERQLRHYLGDREPECAFVNNKDWLLAANYIQFLRDVGRHFSVNRMLTAESVKLRLESGLSFIEFNYMLLQAYDFYVLMRDHGCTLQMGGQDQWGNIVSGVDLCRRKGLEDQAYGATFPLITNASGAKFGKSEAGNIWLDANKTPPFEFYQHWRNTEDADVRKFLLMFTLLETSEIHQMTDVGGNINRAKEILAFEATAMTHGHDQAVKCFANAVQRFGAADPRGEVVTSSSVKDVKVENHVDVPRIEVPVTRIGTVTWIDLLVESGLAKSRSEARRLIQGRGARFNDTTIQHWEEKVQRDSFQSGGLTLRAGKKRFKQIVLVGEG